MKNNEHVQVAQTILEQLGGKRLIAMTGAKHFFAAAGKDNLGGLTFRVPAAAKGINYVAIDLTASDDYTVTFSNIRGAEVTEVAQHKGIYCDMLQSIFEDETGLLASLVGKEVR